MGLDPLAIINAIGPVLVGDVHLAGHGSAATAAMVAIRARVGPPSSICNLLDRCAEPEDEDHLPPDDIITALVALMEAGALQGVE
ncbi:hypothetical protein M3632_00850 [Sphingopyxis alaskensis]|uniref:Uncharacterized protein n=1 Tax=Sphingopyxis alaskensis (strain DSM 13593 / LMG 18877 / RB2256) TaxID=317655 RepID=Q1GPN9_SPHAL|nr:hypothetical protein Sala_2678 [Sphingopyxis alaskensis RB2256]MCM3417903.1 hypothetical protein [Sphingopyxis alaskensis]